MKLRRVYCESCKVRLKLTDRVVYNGAASDHTTERFTHADCYPVWYAVLELSESSETHFEPEYYFANVYDQTQATELLRNYMKGTKRGIYET